MKNYLVIIIVFLMKGAFSQTIVPGDKRLQFDKIKVGSYNMKWVILIDTLQKEIGDIHVSLENKNDRFYITQQVELKGRPGLWIDSTVEEIKTLAPIYHSSTNPQRTMVLHYAPGQVNGFSTDRIKSQTDQINDPIASPYFDSNFYTFLLAYLPLQEGYTATISLYNYNDPTKHGSVNAYVVAVKKGTFSASKGTIPVFVVDVKDDMTTMLHTYYIGQEDRVTYQIAAESNGRKMLMTRN